LALIQAAASATRFRSTHCRSDLLDLCVRVSSSVARKLSLRTDSPPDPVSSAPGPGSPLLRIGPSRTTSSLVCVIGRGTVSQHCALRIPPGDDGKPLEGARLSAITVPEPGGPQSAEPMDRSAMPVWAKRSHMDTPWPDPATSSPRANLDARPPLTFRRVGRASRA
jgi:hypothetical protein